MTQIDKLKSLFRLNRRLLHTQDFAVLWGITNRQTLYTNIKRFLKNGVLFSVQKGLYSLVPIEELNPRELGASLMHDFGYLSCESILATAGIISRVAHAYTFVTSFSRNVSVAGHHFIFHQLSPGFLNQTAGVVEKGSWFEATPARAAADMLYFNPHFHFDSLLLINSQELERMRREVYFAC